MIAYFILHLLPESFSHLKITITHGAEITDQALTISTVLNHLQQFINDKKVTSSSSSNTAFSARCSSSNQWPTCSKGKHNPDTTHSEAQCFQLHPDLKNKNKQSHTTATVTTNPPQSSSPILTPPAMTSYLLAVVEKKTNNCKKSEVLDSSASTPMYRDKSNFKTYSECSETVYLADRTPVKVEGHGTVISRSKHAELTYTNALHIPSLTCNLISLLYLFGKGCHLINCGEKRFEVQKEGKILLDGNIKDGIFIINASPGKSPLTPETRDTLINSYA
ncbi:hypothetical protein CROQUDRAFT_131073 [Cronartium quercuum f. sp. fusiforme G11]|uniref:Retrovirus-related Pol polyprotein from transposon TNT 1-94-like beta-barrel domain-containing protein n=1 Tax=Cronartium quercuum f. sp. fusiforme G11 TaxID=708437 RepID=A0A9P6NP73_9BASI|nr:hypothetical protein CROQUDRAFT_131073 [Cronartium quercuum f. sp. fusiforme G11]